MIMSSRTNPIKRELADFVQSADFNLAEMIEDFEAQEEFLDPEIMNQEEAKYKLQIVIKHLKNAYDEMVN